MSTEWEAWELKVLETFMEGDRIVQLPSKLKKRMVILRWLVEKLDLDRRYTHGEINGFIARFHPDTASIRREWIVHGLMTREKDIYWRVETPRSE